MRYINKFKLAVLMFFLFLFSFAAIAAEKKQEQYSSLPKEHVKKIKKIAEIIGEEISARSIKTVSVNDFTDFKGNPSSIGKAMAREFRKQITSLGGKDFSVAGDNADAVVTGVLVPFKEGGKSKLDIKIIARDSDTIIMSYTGIFKRPKTSKK